MKFISNSREETIKLAYDFAKKLKIGDIVCLNGDLGAGKTAFVSGVASAFGYKGYTSSPTFTLINEYKADIPIYHFDVYRIKYSDEMFDIGIDDYLFGDGICIIEWPEKIRDILPENTININILKNPDMGEDFREIYIETENDK